MNVTLHDALRQCAFLPRALGLVWAATRAWTLAWIVLLTAQGLLPVATVYLTRLFVDHLVAAVSASGSWVSVQPLLVVATLMAGLLLLLEVMQSALEWIRSAQAELLQDHVSALVHAKSVAVDLAFYESPEY